jgi:hypothetical protein
MADADACAALRAAGNARFGAGAFADAAAEYGAAADAARALLAARPGDGAAARELALALNNRAACALKLGAPLRALDDTADAAAACTRPGAREWQRALRAGDWAPDTYAKVLLRRAAAAEAAGAPLAGLPGAMYVATAGGAAPGSRDAGRALARRLATDAPSSGGGSAGEGEGAGALRGRWTRVRVDASSAAPPPRRAAAAAAVDGYLYLFGGQGCSFDALGDAWRLPLRGPPPARWQRLRAPSGRGGPPPDSAPLAFAALPPRRELFIAADGALWGHTPESDDGVFTPKWRRVGPLALPLKGYEDNNPSAMALAPDALFILRYSEDDAAAPPLLLRLGLDDGRLTRVALRSSGGGGGGGAAGAPAARESVHMWYDPCGGDGNGAGGARLLLWAGMERAREGVPGHPHCMGEAPLGELWQLALGSGGAGAAGVSSATWRQLPRDGGGCPPPPRGEAALTTLPLPRDGSSAAAPSDGSRAAAAAPAAVPGAVAAILFGGYSELLPAYSRDGTSMAAYRYLSDAHAWQPALGWRPIHFGCSTSASASAQPAPYPAAQAGLCYDAASGRVLLAGGYAGEEAHPYSSGIYELCVEGVCGDQTPFAEGPAPPPAEASASTASAASAASAAAASPAAAAACAACASLRAGPFAPPLPPPPRAAADAHSGRPASPAAFDALLAAALAARRQPHATWHTSWTCVGGEEASASGGGIGRGTSESDHQPLFAFLFSVHGDFEEHPPRPPPLPPAAPPRYAQALGREPAAADVAWGILAAITPPSSQGGARGVHTPSFYPFPVFRPGSLVFAARMASVVDALAPLLEALGIEAVVEPWADAAEAALTYGTCPWGYNAPGSARCVRCRARPGSVRADGGVVKLRRCGGCERARYCGPECAKADWGAGHKEMCAVLKAGIGGGGAGGGR